MARIVKEQEYAARRDAILDVAQRLVYTKGYEQMAIQDILNELQISKGAFFHYFNSKQLLLEAIIERMRDGVEQLITPIVHDPHLPALEKLQLFFAAILRWKTERKDFLLALLRVWYADDNAIIRQKLYTAGRKRIAPLLTEIIEQGVKEGVLTTAYPDMVSEVVLSIGRDMGEKLGLLVITFRSEDEDLEYIERTIATYTDALERVLGAPEDSLQVVDIEILKEWLVPRKDNA